MTTNAAQEWINTDRQAVIDDVKRLGLDGAVEYQMELIADCIAKGDTRWPVVTHEAMKRAIEETVNSALQPEPLEIELTCDSPASHYGIPVLRIGGVDYSPSDKVPDQVAEAGGTAATAGYLVAAMANRDQLDMDLSRKFCSQWPDGPQPEA